VDYYAEGTLIWLDADVTIRQLSKGARSLDDFCRVFAGGPGGAPAMKPYNFEDVVAALNSVQPYDWASFLNSRLRSTEPHAPLGGIEHSGWKLVYDGERSEFLKAEEAERKMLELSYSLGLKVREDGGVLDVVYAGPAQRAGISPAVTIIAVNNRQFTPAVMREAVEATASATKPLELLIKTGEYYETHRIDYHGGERYPHLVRDPAVADLLSEMIKPQGKR
jgi:predicted metalloprotease with PDZ domain